MVSAVEIRAIVAESRTSWTVFAVWILFAVVAGVALGVGLPLVGARYEGWRGPVASRAFDSALWLDSPRSASPDERGHTLRQGMAADLIGQTIRPGMERADIRAQLGAPSSWPIFAGASWFGKGDEAWWLGESSSVFRRGCEWLYLDYDGNGKLLRAQIVSERAAELSTP